MKHLVIINPISFRKNNDMASVIRDIKAYFDSNASDYLIYISRYPRDAIGVVNEYVSESKEGVRVYSLGGDGILYDCLNGMAGLPNADLAVMPYGTSTDFVRAFGENNQSLFRNIEKQATARTIPTDLMKIGNRCALGFCCIGVEASIIFKYREFSRNSPTFSKLLGDNAYLTGIPFVLLDKKLVYQNYEFRIDDKVYDGRYIGINIANAPCYGGNKVPFPTAYPTDGYIDVTMISGNVNLPLFASIGDYLNGKQHKHPKIFKCIRAKKISVSSDDPLHITVDGEPYFDSKIEVEVLPAAIQIAAPGGVFYERRKSV